MLITLEKITAQKKQLDGLRPFSPEALDNLEKWVEIELTYTSNAIEGNTLTRAETALVLEKGLTVGGKPLKDHLEAINHQEALHAMKQMVDSPSISLDNILALHHLILKGIDDLNAGRIRSMAVRISGSMVVLPNYLKVPALLEQFIKDINTQKEHPVTQAALAHYKLVTIHPFIDGNGRTARLLMNLILMHHGYPPAIITPKDRLYYIKSLEKAQLGGSLEDYLNVIHQAVGRSLKIYSKALSHELPTLGEESRTFLKIGNLAKETRESIATLRYWTKMGLLEVATTTPAGYHLYDTQMIAQCRKIRELQQERYTLEEIARLIYKE